MEYFFEVISVALFGVENGIQLFGLIMVYFFSAGLFAIVAALLVPKRYACSPLLARFLFFWVMAAFITIIGLLFIVLVIWLAEWFPSRQEQVSPFVSVKLPEYTIYPWVNITHVGLTGARDRINNHHLPSDVRVVSLMALQQSSSNTAMSVLSQLLADTDDDIRLLAFGLLDKREQQLNNQISALRKLLAQQSEDISIGHDGVQSKLTTLLRLGELYWALVYENLAQGDLRTFSLTRAEQYTREAIALSQQANPVAWFLLAKVLNEMGRFDEALSAFELAMSAGLSEQRAKPYLAEVAFNLRQYRRVKTVLNEMSVDNLLLPKIRTVAQCWVDPAVLMKGST